jgi:hypothetical protein
MPDRLSGGPTTLLRTSVGAASATIYGAGFVGRDSILAQLRQDIYQAGMETCPPNPYHGLILNP